MDRVSADLGYRFGGQLRETHLTAERTLNLDAEVDQIYRETRGSVCSYLLYLGVSADRAQEVAQEVFLRLYQTMRKGALVENPRAWLFRVAHNLGLKVRSRERAFRVVAPNWERLRAPRRLCGKRAD